jgi:hypothetical protein
LLKERGCWLKTRKKLEEDELANEDKKTAVVGKVRKEKPARRVKQKTASEDKAKEAVNTAGAESQLY